MSSTLRTRTQRGVCECLQTPRTDCTTLRTSVRHQERMYDTPIECTTTRTNVRHQVHGVRHKEQFYDGEPLTKLPAIYSKGEMYADVQRNLLEQDGRAAYLKLHDECATLKNFLNQNFREFELQGGVLCHEGTHFYRAEHRAEQGSRCEG